jgi:hypothetical protein
MFAELNVLMDQLDADPEVKVIVLDAPTNSTPTPQSATAG